MSNVKTITKDHFLETNTIHNIHSIEDHCLDTKQTLLILKMKSNSDFLRKNPKENKLIDYSKCDLEKSNLDRFRGQQSYEQNPNTTFLNEEIDIKQNQELKNFESNMIPQYIKYYN